MVRLYFQPLSVSWVRMQAISTYLSAMILERASSCSRNLLANNSVVAGNVLPKSRTNHCLTPTRSHCSSASFPLTFSTIVMPCSISVGVSVEPSHPYLIHGLIKPEIRFVPDFDDNFLCVGHIISRERISPICSIRPPDRSAFKWGVLLSLFPRVSFDY